MKIVIDTNVLMSGIFFGGIPLRILRKWKDSHFEIVISAEILAEYEEVSERLTKKYPKIDIEPILHLIVMNCEVIDTQDYHAEISRDPDDNKFIECAVCAKAVYIVSGDSDLLDIKKYEDIEILDPRSFLDKFETN